MSRKKAAFFLIGGGITAAAAAWFASRKMQASTDAITDAVDAPPVSLPPSPAVIAALPKFDARLTGYYPYTAREDEKKMEGGTHDRLSSPIYTLEQHLAGKAPYVSISGDPEIFPPGQRIIIDTWPTAIARVVDTGDHFRGIHKIYRIVGREPLDVAVDSSKSFVPKTASVQIVPGDYFGDKKYFGKKNKLNVKEVAYNKFKDQKVAGEIQEGRTIDDEEALARAIQSELSDRPREEQVAAAWAMRNRADVVGTSIHNMLAPKGEYGSPSKSGGYASTRRIPTAAARSLANEVLSADVSEDPTNNAFDFWVPSVQAKMVLLGDIHRAAKKSGDAAKANRYARYANYGDEGAVRVQHARDGLRTVQVVGSVELLGVG